MQLEYRILWFEDQVEQVQPAAARIRDALARLGFEPKITFREVVAATPNPAANLPSQSEVDLILVDWKLGGGQTGDDLARRVRATHRDTEIVFYSSESQKKLRDLIHAQNIDGVRCVNRPNISDRVIGIIHSQLRRILDLNHMRGIVMAATSDLDYTILECLKAVQKVSYPNNPETLAAAIAERVAPRLEYKAKEIRKLGENGRLDKLFKEPFFGSDLRHATLKEELTKLADQIEETHLLEAIEQYPVDVIRPRNVFAHQRAQLVDGKLIIGGYPNGLDQMGMTALRLKLASHHSCLAALLTLLLEMATETGGTALAAHVAAVEHAAEQIAVAQESPAAEQATEPASETK
jgi:DNA-binding response OmpR family regulator